MTTIRWYPYNHQSNSLELLLMEPEPVLPRIIKDRVNSPDNSFIHCPAFRDYYRNVYVIRSPVDIKLIYDKETDFLSVSPQSQNFYDNYFVHRGDQISESSAPLFSFCVKYLFIANKDCMMEQIPVSMHDNNHLNNMRLISGTFNIHRWFRPVEFAFEMLTPEVSIKRGDPLFYVRFIPTDGTKVELVADICTAEERQVVLNCTQLKEAQRILNLKTLYELAKRVYPRLWFNKKKCPFNWRNK